MATTKRINQVLQHPVFSNDLRNSGLEEVTIAKAGLHLMNRSAARKYLGYDPQAVCLSFPYYRTDDYRRLKPAKPLRDQKKSRKYLAPKNGGNHLYILPPSLIPEEILNDTSKPLIITEGEKKTLKGVQEGFWIIGIPGVFCWKEKNGDKDSKLVEEFQFIKWLNREVFIIFDSDAVDNQNILIAEEQLFDQITKLGGYPIIGRIPKPVGEESERFKGKFGIDDLLVARGPTALSEVLKKAKPLPKMYFPGGKFRPPLLGIELLRRNNYIKVKGRGEKERRLYIYDNGVYIKATEVEEETQNLLGMSTSIRKIKEGVTNLQLKAQVIYELLNAPNLIINCTNGLLDVESGILKPHTPNYLSTIQIPVAWNPDVQCERIDRFLEEVLPPDCIEFIDEMIGYLLIPDNRFKKFFILLGGGDNGKSVFLEVIQRLLGIQNCTHVALQELSENRFAKADLEDKLVNIFDDIGAEALKNTSLIKALTGSIDGITRIEKKHRNPYQIRLTAKMIYSANLMPKAYDYSQAWYKRLIIIPFPNTFTEEEGNIDTSLLSTITTEDALQRLFFRGVQGAQKLYKRGGYKMPNSIAEELRRYLKENDNVMAFILDCCHRGTDNKIRRTELYNCYVKYCKRAELYPVSNRQFYKRLRANVTDITEKPLHGYTYFYGINTKSSMD